jgi:hypothetical protein
MTTPTIFLEFCLFGKKIMTMGEPSEDLQYFSKLQKQQRNKKRMGLFKEKIKHLDPLLSNFIFFSFFVCFDQF